MKRLFKYSLIGLIGLYLAATLFMYALQRRLQYFPGGDVVVPAAAGLPGAATVTLRTADGETLSAWSIKAQPGKPTILYFFGNGGRLQYYGRRFARMTASGNGLIAVSYRGYGASTGSPSETGLIEDAETAYRQALADGASPRSIIMMGDSLGTGVAVALAARHRPAALILDSPFLSARHVAEIRYPIFPVDWLMKDQFRSDLLIGSIKAPLLVIHGTADAIVPIESGRALFALANQPKLFWEIPGGTHVSTRDMAVLDRVIDYIAEIARPLDSENR
ncbi:MAG: alpha/beta hydrolase [Beijerinckiaceae bacterium]|nr:alpha/beta hydrolase [Beijerinckiaceae bacterium]